MNTGNVTFNVTKGDVAYTGNKAGIAADSVAGQRYNGKTGGFLYLQSAAVANGSGAATFDVADGATLTIGKDATADSIASYSKTGAVSTITKTGAGDLVVNGDMSAFVGNLTVSSGSMTIAGGIGEYDLAVQEAVNNLVKDGNAPSDSGVATTVTVADQAALTVGNLTVTKALAVNANGDFTAGNITVAKTTYKDLKVSTGEEAFANGFSTSGAATITVAKTAKAGDITVDAGTFTKSGSGSLTAGNATVNADKGLAVSEGTLTVKNFTTGASGSATVGNTGTLEVTGTITGEKQSLNVSGSLATALNNVVDYANGTASKKTNAVVNITNGSFVVTDEGMQYTKAQWDSIKTAAGSNNLKIANGTLVATDAKTPLTLADVGAVQGYAGAADVVEKLTTDTDTYANTAITVDTTIGKLTVQAKDGATKKLANVSVAGTENHKFTLRGNAKGEVFAVPTDVKAIDIGYVYFGEKAADHGVVANGLTVSNKAGVDAGSFDFTGDVELGALFTVNKGATARFLGDVTEKAAPTVDLRSVTDADKAIANNGTVVIGTVPAADATDKTLQINVTTETGNSGLTVFGAKHEAAALQYKAAAADNNVIYVGEQTTLNKSQQFGALDTTATAPENVVAIDLDSVAANGYTAKSGAILKAATDVTITDSAINNPSFSVDLLNLNSKVLTIAETGATLNLGTAFAEGTAVKLGNAFYNDGRVAADGTFAVVTDEEAVLDVETSGLHTAGAVVQAVRSYEKPTNGIAAIVYNNWEAWNQEYKKSFFEQAKAAGLLNDHVTLEEFDPETSVATGKQAAFLQLGEQIGNAQWTAITNAEHAATNMAVLGGAFTTTLDVNDQVTAVLNRRMSLANLNVSRNETGVTPWVDVFGTMNEGKRLFGNGMGYEADIYGAVLGFDYTATCGSVLGLAINVGTSDGNSTGNGQKVDNDQDFYGVSAYASRQFGSFNTKLDLGYLVTKNDLKTASSYFGATSEKLDAKVFTVGLGAEFLASAGAVNVVPHAGIRLTTIDMDESNFGADYDKMTVYQLPLGVTFSGSFDAAGWQVAPQFDLSVVPTFGDKDAVATYAGNVKDTTRVVDTNPVQATLGVSAQNGAWTFGLNYGLTAGGDDRMNNSLNANVRYTF